MDIRQRQLPTARIPKAEIYNAYERYCRGHERVETAENIFWRDLRSSGKFRDDMVQRSRFEGERVQTVAGLRVSLDEATLPFAVGDDFDD